MSVPKILQIRFTYDGSYSQFEPILPSFCDRLATVPGLEWKIWAYNEATHEGAGLYLFADEASARSYADGMVAEMAALVTNPTAHLYDFHEAATAATRGPVALAGVGS